MPPFATFLVRNSTFVNICWMHGQWLNGVCFIAISSCILFYWIKKKTFSKFPLCFFYIFYLFIELVGKKKRSMMAFPFTFYCSTCDDDYIRINKFLFPRLELALKETIFFCTKITFGEGGKTKYGLFWWATLVMMQTNAR